MPIIDNVKSGVSQAAVLISDVTQNLLEKNRLNAQLNRLRLTIKNESIILKNAYAELGKHFYKLKSVELFDEMDTAPLFEIIKESTEKIEKAKTRYNLLLQIKDEESFVVSGRLDIDEFGDIKKAEPVKDIAKSIQEKTEPVVNQIKETTGDIVEFAKEKSEPIVRQIKEKAEDFAEYTKEKAEPVIHKIKLKSSAEKAVSSGKDAAKALRVKSKALKEKAKEKAEELFKSHEQEAEIAEISDVSDIAQDIADAAVENSVSEYVSEAPIAIEFTETPEGETAEDSDAF